MLGLSKLLALANGFSLLQRLTPTYPSADSSWSFKTRLLLSSLGVLSLGPKWKLLFLLLGIHSQFIAWVHCLLFIYGSFSLAGVSQDRDPVSFIYPQSLAQCLIHNKYSTSMAGWRVNDEWMNEWVSEQMLSMEPKTSQVCKDNAKQTFWNKCMWNVEKVNLWTKNKYWKEVLVWEIQSWLRH